MKIACKYAVIQFQPYAETGEFANVGVVVSVPKFNYFDFKLASGRFARVTNFFDDLDGEVYKAAINGYENELTHIKSQVLTLNGEKHLRYVEELTRYRESLIRFSNLRTIGTENPEQLIEQLYDRYVGRNFLTPEYRENVMVKAIRKDFNAQNLGVKYKQKVIEAGLRNVSLPLVSQVGDKLRIIKPLAFEQKTSTKIIEHGEHWWNRVNWLIKENMITPDKVLLPVEGPQSKGKLQEAYKEITNELKLLDVRIVDFEEKDAIFAFAAADLESQRFELH